MTVGRQRVPDASRLGETIERAAGAIGNHLTNDGRQQKYEKEQLQLFIAQQQRSGAPQPAEPAAARQQTTNFANYLKVSAQLPEQLDALRKEADADPETALETFTGGLENVRALVNAEPDAHLRDDLLTDYGEYSKQHLAQLQKGNETQLLNRIGLVVSRRSNEAIEAALNSENREERDAALSRFVGTLDDFVSRGLISPEHAHEQRYKAWFNITRTTLDRMTPRAAFEAAKQLAQKVKPMDCPRFVGEHHARYDAEQAQFGVARSARLAPAPLKKPFDGDGMSAAEMMRSSVGANIRLRSNVMLNDTSQSPEITSRPLPDVGRRAPTDAELTPSDVYRETTTSSVGTGKAAYVPRSRQPNEPPSKEKWKSTAHYQTMEKGVQDAPPVDPEAGLYDRIGLRLRERLEKSPNLVISGQDTDGRPYKTLLRVGTDLKSDGVNALNLRGADMLSEILFDEVKHFNTVFEAEEWLKEQGHPIDEKEGLLPLGTPGFHAGIVDKPNPRDPRMVLGTIGFEPQEQRAQTKAHESGHMISELLDLEHYFASMPNADQEIMGRELRAIIQKRGSKSEEWPKSPEEWIADFFMRYLTEPDETKKTAPFTSSVIRKLWNENDRVNKLLILSQGEGKTSIA
ncbi:MAG: hypothetical protein H7Z38_15960 [Rubrivivax sp.]|nr:hypothetical protein [Pyrinomonadaceae bacterium]